MLASPMSNMGIENRRLACDRCRGQKLKCIREEDSTACRRCISAKAICVFGYPNPPGRPPAAPRGRDGAAQLQQQQQQQVQQQIQQQVQQPPPPPPQYQQPPVTLPHQQPVSSPVSIHPLPMRNHVDDTLLLDMLYDTSFDTMSFRNESFDDHMTGSGELFPTESTSSSHSLSSLDGSAMRSQCIEQLLVMTADMYKLQNRYSPFMNPNVGLDALRSFPTELAGLVMKLATTFLSLAESVTVDQRSIFATANTVDDDAFMNMLTGNSVPSSRQSSGPPSHVPSPSYASSASSTGSFMYCPSFESDRSFALQFIACYLRLLQLYQILYTAILNHIRWCDSEPQVRQPVWAGLNVGGAALSAFPELQMRLIVQASVQVMSQIEQRLGLHEDYRLSRRSSQEGRGILGAMNVPPQLIKLCMEESLAGQGQGRGLITRIADTAERLDTLLSTSDRK